MAEKPGHCFACYRLIRPGQIYHLTIEFEVLCEDCALSQGAIRVREDLAVEIRRDRLLIQRGGAQVEVFPGEIRHLVNPLVKAVVRLVEQKIAETYHSGECAVGYAAAPVPISGARCPRKQARIGSRRRDLVPNCHRARNTLKAPRSRLKKHQPLMPLPILSAKSPPSALSSIETLQQPYTPRLQMSLLARIRLL